MNKIPRLGQIVYYLDETMGYVLSDCPICSGSQEVEIKGEMFLCPKCDGLPYRVLQAKDIKIKGPYNIDSFSIVVNKEGMTGCVSLNSYIQQDLEDVFPTQADALAERKRRLHE